VLRRFDGAWVFERDLATLCPLFSSGTMRKGLRFLVDDFCAFSKANDSGIPDGFYLLVCGLLSWP
jgi:hypothetical protein